MTTNKKIFNELSELTYNWCKKTCKCLGSCCSDEDCRVAGEYAESKGISIPPTGNKIRFLTTDGICIVPPELRPLCSVHQCDIASIGVFKGDEKLTARYFELRDSITEL